MEIVLGVVFGIVGVVLVFRPTNQGAKGVRSANGTRVPIATLLGITLLSVAMSTIYFYFF